MKTLAIAVVGTASLVASADAGFLGFVALAKQSGSNVIVDIYTAVGNASDKFLNVYNLTGSTTAAGGFFQAAGLTNKTWKPDAAGFTATRNSVDIFMTAGTFSGGAYGGEYYASTNSNADPNFTGTSWSPTPASPAANTIPALAGWYTGDPTSVDNSAQLLSSLSAGYTRIDSVATPAAGTTGGTAGSAGAQYGIWCGHLVIAGTLNAQTLMGGIGNTSATIIWNAAASIKDGVSGVTSQGQSQFVVPAPGALALLGVAGFASRRRRA